MYIYLNQAFLVEIPKPYIFKTMFFGKFFYINKSIPKSHTTYNLIKNSFDCQYFKTFII